MDKIELIKTKTAELLEHCHAYYDLDCPKISDAEYDRLYDELKQLEDEANFWLANSPTRKVQGDVLPYLTKVKHSVPMLSADKSTDIQDVFRFANNHEVLVSYKLDGASIVVKFQDGKFIQALSRGSGTDGEDITHTVKMIKNLPLTIPYKGYLEVRGEALIPWKDYNEMCKEEDIGHSRNVCSGALRSLDASKAAQRNIYFYAFTLVNWKEVGVKTKGETFKFLFSNGFDIVPFIYATTNEQIENAIRVLNREEYENPTDGWCFEFNDLQYGESLGSTEHHDRKLYALKPRITSVSTKFRGIEYRACRTGIVSLTALFDPVDIGNTMVGRCTLHNVDFFENLKLGVGDKIEVTKFNEIIPGIVSNLTQSGTYELIDHCPSCGTKLEIKNTGTANVLYCPNEECPSKNLAKFTHFVSKNCMDIRNLSEATLEFLIDKGWLHAFKDIYHLADYKNEWQQCEGFGKASVEKILDSIKTSRKVKLANFISALGVEQVGTSAAKTISAHFNGSFEAFFDALMGNFDWSSLEDFGEITARNIANYGLQNGDIVANLAEEMEFIVDEKQEVKNDFISGKVFCVTGAFATMKRSEIEKIITDRGGKLSGSVSSKTNWLLTNDAGSGSSKAKKAVELNIPIMSEQEFLSKI